MLTKSSRLLSEKSVTVENRTDFEIDLPQIADLVDFLKGELGIEESITVDVTFVDANVMADLHIRYMGLMGPTDVLSFPATDVLEGPIDPTSLRDQLTLGDIVLCPSILSSAKSVSSHMFWKIVTRVVHAFLHLLGFDHVTAQGWRAMRIREQALLFEWSTLAAGIPYVADYVNNKRSLYSNKID